MTISSGVLAVMISGVSVGVSVLSLAVSYLAYRRGAARVRVRFEYLRYPGRPIMLKVENRGTASIQITQGEVWYWVSKSNAPSRERPRNGGRLYFELPGAADGPDLPYTLEGLHEERWSIPRYSDDMNKILYIRAKIEFGSGKIIWSPKGRVWRFDSANDPGVRTRSR